MNSRYLINENGKPFSSSELRTLCQQLDDLKEDDRKEYRNRNADTISKSNSKRLLIVSGPGTGKSYLFLSRIDYWLGNNPQTKILVTSFVRKLVVDLQNDISNDEKLSDEQKKQTTASTLHKFARSIVEKNHGTLKWAFKPYFKIIGQSWKEIVWRDVLAFHQELDTNIYIWQQFEEQLHNNNFENGDDWQQLKHTYYKLCHFYNAAGFSDLILRAIVALKENPDLNEYNFFIIDEYQDFNLAEEAFIEQLAYNPKSLLVVGDDGQVLYEKLKSGKPTLIRNLYKNEDYANGMLPFCGRSSFHITKTANHFIQQCRDAESIEKIYLPLKTNSDEPKVQIIACAAPSTAVDYVEKFVANNKTEIDDRKKQLETGEAKDAFLLILTPAKKVNFYKYLRFNGKKKLDELVSAYQTEIRSFSEDYYQLLSYYSLANNPDNNFSFRKVLHYEGVLEDRVHELIAEAMRDDKNFYDLDSQEIKDALSKCNKTKTILDNEKSATEKLDQISNLISVSDREKLKSDMDRKAINEREMPRLEHEEEEEAELEEIEVKRMGAVELMTIVGSKGLSADHVIVIGFDDVNMKHVTKNAFYVAITRARKSLHILTALKAGGATKAHKFLEHLSEAHIEFYKYKKTNHSKTFLNGKQGFVDYINLISRRTS